MKGLLLTCFKIAIYMMFSTNTQVLGQSFLQAPLRHECSSASSQENSLAVKYTSILTRISREVLNEMYPDERFRVCAKIGTGWFGETFSGIDSKTGEEVAIKIETVGQESSSIFNEPEIYKVLQGAIGFPKVQWSGVEKDHKMMVFSLLGPNLKVLLYLCGGQFTLKTVLMIAYQMIDRYESLHNRNIIHYDIKPENYLMGQGQDANILHVIDFGLTHKYIMPGTPGAPEIYLQWAPAPRDDLESIAYLWMYFLKGSLWWEGGDKTMKELYEMSKKIKIKTPVSTLCPECPEEFTHYVEYCRGLTPDQKPDYNYLKNLMGDLYFRNYGEFDHQYDWVVSGYTL